MMNDIARLLESGNPPDWFPPGQQIDFKGKRRDLLNCMPLDDLLWTVENIIKMHREHFADPNYLEHEYRPAQVKGNFDTSGQLACATLPNLLNQANGNYDIIGHACAILARYLYAASLGEKEGLPLVLELRGDIAKSATIGINNRRVQSEKAKNLRGKIGDDESGEAFANILSTLASRKDALGDFIPAPDLWEPLFSELQAVGAEPKLVRNNSEPRKSRYNYMADDKKKHITRGRFEARISAIRKKLFR